jgi:hypothetical protein
VLNIYLSDIHAYGDFEFEHNIRRNTVRYQTLFNNAADTLIPEPNILIENADNADIWMSHRQDRHAKQGDDAPPFPKELTRRL